MIAFIWAEDLDGNIGNQGTLPWHLPADMARFKQTTMGHTVVMGKTTFLSMRRPLPKRRNIVLSTSLAPQEGIEVVRSVTELKQLLQQTTDDVFIIGGAKVFAATYSLTDCLVRTVIETTFVGDTKIPPIDYANWRLTDSTDYSADDKNTVPYRFETWCR